MSTKSKKLKICYGEDIISLPKEELLSVLPSANEFNLKVLILAASDKKLRSDYSEFSREICTSLDCTPTALNRAVKFWQEKGILSLIECDAEAKAETSGDKPAEKEDGKYLQTSELPSYTEGRIAEIIEKSTDLNGVIDACQQMTGKIFTTAEVQTVVRLYDHLRLDGDYIITLFAYCCDNGKKSLRYIEKTAIGMYDEGIDTTAALNEHIKRLERRDELMGRVKALIGASDRQLTPKEKKLIEQWLATWKLDIDVITRAYEVTVDSIGSVKLPYMNKVLENWYNSGLTTVKAIEKSLKDYKKKKTESEKNASGFETNEYFEAALARAQRYIDEKK